jgi:hypothetical protein
MDGKEMGHNFSKTTSNDLNITRTGQFFHRLFAIQVKEVTCVIDNECCTGPCIYHDFFP